MPAVPRFDIAERRARIGVRHRLAPSHRTDDVVAIAESLVGLHSSDPVSPYLSATARMRQPSMDPLATALYEDRTLVRHHAMRRTLWVFTPEVARLAHASTTIGLAANQRRLLRQLLEDSGTVDDPEAWIVQAEADTLAALHRAGPSSTRQIGKAVPALTMKLRLAPGKTWGADVAAHTRLLLLLGFEGALVRTRPTGSWIQSEYTWAVAEDWLPGGLQGEDPAAAAAELARRWLRAFGPAPMSDLQWWTGWNGRVTSAAIAASGAIEVDLDGSSGWVGADDLGRVGEPGPWVALLPGLDPTTMGWRDRDWYLSPDAKAALFDRNGNAGPAIWIDGEVVGGWVQRADGRIATQLFVDVGRANTDGVAAAAHDLEILLGDSRFKVRFPAPMQRDLLA
ncbi:MAG: hypothetical protein JWM34_2549 [Ilumatobacteraceae bacterium]|nr:hypothetical protein [Ilumatobacteraceae bacterium]